MHSFSVRSHLLISLVTNNYDLHKCVDMHCHRTQVDAYVTKRVIFTRRFLHYRLTSTYIQVKCILLLLIVYDIWLTCRILTIYLYTYMYNCSNVLLKLLSQLCRNFQLKLLIVIMGFCLRATSVWILYFGYIFCSPSIIQF